MNKVPQLRGRLLGLVAAVRARSAGDDLVGLVMFLYGIVGESQYLGANDPANFGGVAIAILTLFRVSTLAGWSLLYKINYFGCDRFDAGIYTVVANARATRAGEDPTTNGFGDFDNGRQRRERGRTAHRGDRLLLHKHRRERRTSSSRASRSSRRPCSRSMEMNERQKLDKAALLDSPRASASGSTWSS